MGWRNANRIVQIPETQFSPDFTDFIIMKRGLGWCNWQDITFTIVHSAGKQWKVSSLFAPHFSGFVDKSSLLGSGWLAFKKLFSFVGSLINTVLNVFHFKFEKYQLLLFLNRNIQEK